MNEFDYEVLIVDDDDVARESITRGMRANGIDLPVTLATDGVDALAVLRGKDPERPIRSPLLILLDLNMPEMNGFEFLRELRADPRLTRHVVFAVTTSESRQDHFFAYQHHVAGYIVKTAADRWHSRLAMLLKSYREGVRLPN
jgi:CheY-like chemotaxis protein